MATGMEGLSNQADQLEGHSAGLRDAVDNGKLVMDPQAAERVAKVYEDKADDIQKQVSRAQRLLTNNTFGDCFTGHQLEQKFNEKVSGGAESAQSGGGTEAALIPMLRKAEQILRDMAQAYQDSARDMENTDDENARSLGRPGV